MNQIVKQGTLIAIRNNTKAAQSIGGFRAVVRGAVRAFTVSSRRRLLRLFAALDSNAPALFVTLTRTKGSTHGQLRQAYNAFREAMRRRHPKAAWVWRKELHKSGTPHLHLIVFNVPRIEAGWLWDTWERICGERQRVDIQRLTSNSGAFRYASKYLAKTDGAAERGSSLVLDANLHGQPDDKIGRWWGVHQRELLPFAETTEFDECDTDIIEYLRWYIGKCVFRSKHPISANISVIAFDAASMFDFIERCLGRSPCAADVPLVK